jgi:hypothetical protein
VVTDNSSFAMSSEIPDITSDFLNIEIAPKIMRIMK